MTGDDDGSWHDKQEVILAAGVAGVILLALLVWAVIHTANKSTPSSVELPPSSATSSTYTTPSTSSTTYTVPRVQTSEDNPVLTGPPPPSTPDSTDDAETTTETSSANPYPTTTPTNAGHI